MTYKFTTLAFSFLSLGFAGCQMAHKSTSVDRAETTSYMTVSGLAGWARNAMPLSGVLPDAHRFIAAGHKVEILSREAELPKSWESIISFCASIQCEVTASSLTARTRDFSASGSIVMRVVTGFCKAVRAGRKARQRGSAQHGKRRQNFGGRGHRSQTEESDGVPRQLARHAGKAVTGA